MNGELEWAIDLGDKVLPTWSYTATEETLVDGISNFEVEQDGEEIVVKVSGTLSGLRRVLDRILDADQEAAR